MPIKLLNIETIKLINNTQVITSIYSVIKELVENSIDAQAQNIEINLIDNGLTLIEVKDNGTGINRDDVHYMALPAYTSKISDFCDLDLLSTYGFRGEALNAICKVSDVTVYTKTYNDETVIHYTFNNDGQIINTDLSHGSTGTTVQIRNLFKNMPVRRTILNSQKTMNQENKLIEILLKSYAICKPLIKFTYRVNSTINFIKPSCKTLAEAVKYVYGLHEFSKLSCLQKNISQAEIQLFIPKKQAAETINIPQNGLQFLCVNDRPVKCKEIEKILSKRVSEYLNAFNLNFNKITFCVLLKVDPSILDVNLEPNKDKIFLKNKVEILKEIDSSLKKFYDLESHIEPLQSNKLNECQLSINMNELENSNENKKDSPAHKKRRMILKNQTTEKVDLVKFVQDHRSDVVTDKCFLKNVNELELSDSDSNDMEELPTNSNNITKKLSENCNKLLDMQENSELFDHVQNVTIKNKIVDDSFSQLPEVDLGEDFNYHEISGPSKNLCLLNSTIIQKNINNEQKNIEWSRGQPHLKIGVTVGDKDELTNEINNGQRIEQSDSNLKDCLSVIEDIENIKYNKEMICDMNESMIIINQCNQDVKKTAIKQKADIKKNLNSADYKIKNGLILFDDVSERSKISFAEDNSDLSNKSSTAFTLYCATTRPKIVEQHPEFTPVEVAVYMNKLWKKISKEERENYRSLAKNLYSNEDIKSHLKQKSKIEIIAVQKEKNKKQLIKMLDNMKHNKIQIKNENMMMRTFKPWNISMLLVTQKFKNKLKINAEISIIGSLNSVLWVINMKKDLFVLNITELQIKLNMPTCQVTAVYANKLIQNWFMQKNDMTIFYPLYRATI